MQKPFNEFRQYLASRDRRLCQIIIDGLKNSSRKQGSEKISIQIEFENLFNEVFDGVAHEKYYEIFYDFCKSITEHKVELKKIDEIKYYKKMSIFKKIKIHCYVVKYGCKFVQSTLNDLCVQIKKDGIDARVKKSSQTKKQLDATQKNRHKTAMMNKKPTKRYKNTAEIKTIYKEKLLNLAQTEHLRIQEIKRNFFLRRLEMAISQSLGMDAQS